ncbi:MAG: hypothetical protein H6739_05050 [Alphaproteobacteria bacterium]|nr:hypothetical protein [Alphaproteobacteria bacterium]
MSARLAILLVGLTAGCTLSNDVECVDHAMCDEGEICHQNECKPAECLDSTSCEIGNYCDQVTFRCTEGCSADTDCRAGQACNQNTNSCVQVGCRNTELDCPVGQFCDTVTGDCYAATPRMCSSQCDLGSFNPDGVCDRSESCQVSSIGDTCRTDRDCGTGWACDTFTDGNNYCHADYCLPSCNPNAEGDCPAGFACISDGSGGGICLGDCAWLTENGHL